MKMAKKKKVQKKRKTAVLNKKVGYWLFLLGIFIAVIAGLITLKSMNQNVIWVLASLGLIVGLFNLKLKNELSFLIASMVLIMVSGYLTVIPSIGLTLATILSYIAVFVSAAAIVVALKVVYYFEK